jgi:hypothetical protein
MSGINAVAAVETTERQANMIAVVAGILNSMGIVLISILRVYPRDEFSHLRKRCFPKLKDVPAMW